MLLKRRRSLGPGAASLRTVRLVAGLLGLAAGLAACGSTQPAGSMQANAAGNSNVPAAPNVDRSKCSDKGKQVITADTNQDKKPDVWKFFVMAGDVQILSCKQVDLNHDGKIDIVYYYDD